MPSPSPEPHPRPPAVDRALLRVYLNDHLAGSVAGLRRMRRTAEALAGTPAGTGMQRVVREVELERDELKGIVESLGLPLSRPKQVATWTAERLSRLKSNGRVVRHSSMTALLEVELLRSAVMGKRGLWQTLVDVGPAIDLDPGRAAALLSQAERQIETLEAVHAYVRVRALRERSAL